MTLRRRSPPRGVTVAALVAAAATWLVSARASAQARPRFDNVVLVSIDSLRADMPWAGYPRAIAPRLTAIEARSVSYTRAYAVSSYTAMSLGGLLSGRYPGELERDGWFFGSYGKSAVFFPEVLRQAGVMTVSAHAHGYFKRNGMERGFDRWSLVPKLKWNNLTDENVTSPEHEALAERELEAAAATGKRFFAWFHFLDPHDEYIAHPEYPAWGRSQRARYDAEVQYTDQYVGKLFDFIVSKPWGKSTVVIVTADHGEAFGEHKHWRHGFELWEPLVRVPLFFFAPGLAGKRIASPRSCIDLAPTILELLGAPAPKGLRGRSLVSELSGAELPEVPVILDLPATSDGGRRRGVMKGNRKVVAIEKDAYLKVYDLAADPGEESPIPSKDPRFAESRALYKEAVSVIEDRPPTKCRDACLNGGYLKGHMPGK
jgi:arylsulfatase A-like enzyme